MKVCYYGNVFLFPAMDSSALYVHPFDGKVRIFRKVHIICELPHSASSIGYKGKVTFFVNKTKLITVNSAGCKSSSARVETKYYRISCQPSKFVLNMSRFDYLCSGFWSCGTEKGNSNSVLIKALEGSK